MATAHTSCLSASEPGRCCPCLALPAPLLDPGPVSRLPARFPRAAAAKGPPTCSGTCARRVCLASGGDSLAARGPNLLDLHQPQWHRRQLPRHYQRRRTSRAGPARCPFRDVAHCLHDFLSGSPVPAIQKAVTDLGPVTLVLGRCFAGVCAVLPLRCLILLRGHHREVTLMVASGLGIREWGRGLYLLPVWTSSHYF